MEYLAETTARHRISAGDTVCSKCGESIPEGELFLTRSGNDLHVQCDRGDFKKSAVVIGLVVLVLYLLAITLGGA